MNKNNSPSWTTYAPLPTKTDEIYPAKFGFVNLYEIAFDVFSDFVMEARNKKIRLILNTDDNWSEGQTTDPRLNIYGDRQQLREMMAQMVKNAIAQTLEGTIQLQINAVNDQFVIEVSDTGIGIHPDEKITLVETLYRGKMCRITYVQDPETSMARIAQQLQTHNAQLELFIENGKGMKRRLIVPKAQPKENSAQPAQYAALV